MLTRKTLSDCSRLRSGFTLVELLVVVSIVTVLAAIALPTLKNGLREQRVSRAAGLIQQYIEEARARAIANRRPVGVMLKRAGTDNEINRSQVTRLRLCETPGPYVGDLINVSKARLKYVADPAKYIEDRVDNGLAQNNNWLHSNGTTMQMQGLIVLQFQPLDAFLLNAVLTMNNTSIQIGDFILIGDNQLPRRIVDIREELMRPSEPWLPINTQDDPAISPDKRVEIVVEYAPIGWAPASFKNFIPTTAPSINFGFEVGFRIMRQPIPSYAAELEIPDKTVIDMLYSGFGAFGSQFSPLKLQDDYTPGDTTPVFDRVNSVDYGDVWIVFAPDGSVMEVYYGSASTTVHRVIPVNDIFLLVGRAGQVYPESPLTGDTAGIPNILDPQAIWLSINRMSGRVSQHGINIPTTVPSSVAATIGQSRLYARGSGAGF